MRPNDKRHVDDVLNEVGDEFTTHDVIARMKTKGYSRVPIPRQVSGYLRMNERVEAYRKEYDPSRNCSVMIWRKKYDRDE